MMWVSISLAEAIPIDTHNILFHGKIFSTMSQDYHPLSFDTNQIFLPLSRALLLSPFSRRFSLFGANLAYVPVISCRVFQVGIFVNILSTKRNAMFLFAILVVKIIDFKNCFYSVVLPSNKDLDCIVSP